MQQRKEFLKQNMIWDYLTILTSMETQSWLQKKFTTWKTVTLQEMLQPSLWFY